MARFLEVVAVILWPLIRLFVKKSNRCTVCITSEKCEPLIDGKCLPCRSDKGMAKPIEAINSARSELENFNSDVMALRDSRSSYDGLVLLSGGKDSAYILYRLRTEFPNLRILSLFVENGFSSRIALNNAAEIAFKLQSDFLVVNSKISIFKDTFRNAFLSLNGRGASGVIDHADGTLIFKTGLEFAKSLEIPAVFSGLSYAQVRQIVRTEAYKIVNDHGPLEVFPLAVWRTSETEIRKFVVEKSLIKQGNESPVVSNNELILTMSALDVLNLGYCSFEPEFALQIREGKADRKTWLYAFELLEFAARRGILNSEMQKTLKKLDLELNDILPKGSRK